MGDNGKQRERETKSFPAFVTKIDADQGVVEHLVAVFGNVDLGGDVIHPGAFTKTITERGHKVRVIDAHNYQSVMSVIGKPLAMWEIPREALPPKVLMEYPETTGGLMARTQYLMDTPEGKGAFIRIRDDAVDEYSFGFDALDVDYEKRDVDGKEQTVRNLRTLRLYEYGPVVFAMNPATTTLSAKEMESEDMVDDNEDKAASGSTSLPLASRERAWDATAAVRRVRSWADAEDGPNAKYRRAFFWYDADSADEFGAYKLPFADVIDGELHAVPRGVFAVAAALQSSRGGVNIPEGDAGGVRSRVARYYGRMRSQFDDDSIVPPWEKAMDETPEEKEAALDPDEAKAGRVLAARNIDRLAGALRTILDVLDDAGVETESLLPKPKPKQDDEEEGEDEKGAVLDHVKAKLNERYTDEADGDEEPDRFEPGDEKEDTPPDEQAGDEQQDGDGAGTEEPPPTLETDALLQLIDIEQQELELLTIS